MPSWVKGHLGSTRGQIAVKISMATKSSSTSKVPGQSVMHCLDQMHAGATRGQAESNCLEMPIRPPNVAKVGFDSEQNK